MSKLAVMQKKIGKLLQTSLNKFYRHKIFMFERKKEKVPELKKLKKASNVVQKNFTQTKQIPGQSVLYLLRCFNIFSRYPKVGLVWKSFLCRLLSEEGMFKTNFGALSAKNNIVIPVQSRGLKSKTTKTTGPSETTTEVQNKTEEPPKEGDTETPTITGVLTGIEEQKLYTEAPQKNLKRDWKDIEDTPSSDTPSSDTPPSPPPPPQKTKLSCPLTPQEFCSTEMNELRSNNQSPNLSFLSFSEQFMPKPTGIRDNNNIESIIDSAKNYGGVLAPKLQTYEYLTHQKPKMKALLFEPKTLQLKYDAVDAPIKIFKDEVLVQVAYSGVCGTDLFITEGKVSCGDNPIILGHEISGTVYAVGKEVDHLMPGDKVAVNAYTACCVCRYCVRGLFSGCLNEGLNNSIGLSRNGGWAEFVVVKKSQAHKVPDQVELDQAALIQPLSCVLSAMSKLKILHEMDILIQGLGLNGMLWASVLHSQGYKKVIVCDHISKRRSGFESLGTNYPIISPEEIGNHAMDLVVECTGSQEAMERCLSVLNPNGQMCFFGKPHPVTEVKCFPYEIIRKEITIVGNTGNAFHFSKAIDTANAMGLRYLDFNKLGVRTFDLENFREAFELKKAQEVSKIIFKLES